MNSTHTIVPPITAPLRALWSAWLLGLLILGCGPAPEPVQEPASREAPTVEPAKSAEPPAAPSREQQLEQADQLTEAGQLDEATIVLKRLLVADPSDVEVIFRLALTKANGGDLPAAIEFLESIPEDHPEAGLPALGQAADWSFQIGQYADAERKYSRLLDFVPDAGRAHRQLAYLFNRQGRRHEAAVHVRQLCRLGDFRQDELHSLIVLSDAMASEDGGKDDGSIRYEPIGVSGTARVLFTKQRFAEAAALLRDSVAENTAPPSVVALYGRSLAEAQDDDGFRQWVRQTDDSVRDFSEYWAAWTAYLAGQQQPRAAVRAALEALDRDPTDFLTINRLLHMLKILGDADGYAKWEQRWKALHQVLTANNSISNAQTPNVDAIDELASQLFAIDRKLEAVAWKSLEAYYRSLPAEVMEHWNTQRQQLVSADDGFPGRQTRLCGMELGAYPLPDIEVAVRSPAAQPPKPSPLKSAPHPAAFRNVAAEIGLTHAYAVARDPRADGFAMYQQAGGGIAVLDYDLDGAADLYCAQGAADPPEFLADRSDVLYRQIDGQLDDVTADAAVTERRYTIGCTAGDWNQDGFADIIATNIGANVLLINNGDGTFSTSPLAGSDDLQRMPASVAMADLDGDQLPDIMELNYIQDPEIGRLPQRDASGDVVDAVGPGDFASAMDRIGTNDGQGTAVFQAISQRASDAHKGLGVVIADFDGQPGNDVFVGNDKSPNQMWVRDQSTGHWSDLAVVNGSAYSSAGAATASMGIAASDFDRNGTLDLHIANFQNESVCLYFNQDGSFRDRAIEYGLGVPSRSVLGFGSQPLDYDNDGLPDLAVSNGHIDRYQSMVGPFEQLPQLFGNLAGRFQRVDVDDPSGYWDTGHLGRTLATLDFNRDGKNDLVISHVGETTALLLNETATQHHWLQLRLVGVESERDAIGAKITIQVANRQLTGWVIGGDGYLAKNEAVVSFGLGDANSVDQIQVQWPSGIRQQFGPTAADRRILLIENQPDLDWPGNEIH
ncbi:tetratricopeptide repeat protein [Stieleria neptunia]|uniref:Tetratricopeptide repeat protein n=1 Tax=Stieleria neptunia TaxID=2527979 RepID=A0A518HL40_9BACT|nr:tetratricopeptide repeat protein [Stieleria neptunia]